MRTFALLAVVMAHANFLNPGFQILNRVIASFSGCGVAIFFFAAGVYWRWKPLSLTLRKICKLLPPWILIGSMVYMFSAMKSGFSLGAWLLWLMGINTYLWFLTVYCTIQIFFCILRLERKTGLMVCILITVISRVMTAYFGLSGYRAFLNPLNWAGFFAAGVLYQQNAGLQMWKSRYVSAFCQITAATAILLFAYLGTLVPTMRFDYWSYFDCFRQFAWIAVLLPISRALSKVHGYEIGRASLPIYLLHIPVIGYLTNHLSVGFPVVVLLSVAVICVLYLCLFFAKHIASMVNLDKLFSAVTGF